MFFDIAVHFVRRTVLLLAMTTPVTVDPRVCAVVSMFLIITVSPLSSAVVASIIVVHTLIVVVAPAEATHAGLHVQIWSHVCTTSLHWRSWHLILSATRLGPELVLILINICLELLKGRLI